MTPTKKDLDRAREVHDKYNMPDERLTLAFAQALADERERCAKIAEKFYMTSGFSQWTYTIDIASAIRNSGGGA